MALLGSPQPKSVPQVVSIYLGGWTIAGLSAGFLFGLVAFPFVALFAGAAVGVVVGAFASRSAANAFRDGRGPRLVFPRVRRWALSGAVIGYVSGTAAWFLWHRFAGSTFEEWLVKHPKSAGLLPAGLPAAGYLAGLLAGFVREAMRAPSPDVTDVFN